MAEVINQIKSKKNYWIPVVGVVAVIALVWLVMYYGQNSY